MGLFTTLSFVLAEGILSAWKTTLLLLLEYDVAYHFSDYCYSTLVFPLFTRIY